jgi:hypothetical protein
MIHLPVSLGEAIDKLTILDIKCDKIKDERVNDVKYEFQILYSELKEYIEKYDKLYNEMKKINLIIWNQMDKLRDEINETEYLKLCKDSVESNDIRFRIKNKINLISNSLLKEQKSYKKNTLIIVLNCDDELFHLFINPIQHVSYVYDEIIIQSSKNIDYIKNEFAFDNTIKYNIDIENNDSKQIIFDDITYTSIDIYNRMNINIDELL